MFNYDKLPITITFDIEAGKATFDFEQWFKKAKVDKLFPEVCFENMCQTNIGALRLQHIISSNQNKEFFDTGIIKIIDRKTKKVRGKIELKGFNLALMYQFQTNVFDITNMGPDPIYPKINIDLNKELIEFDFIKTAKVKVVMFTLAQPKSKTCPTCNQAIKN